MQHRTRDVLIRERTQIINALRRSGRARHGGGAGRQRGEGIARDRGGQRGYAVADRCASERHLVPAAQLEAVQTLIGSIEKRIKMQHRSNEASQRVETIPGIGVLGASAITATAVDPTVFRSGRDFAAWIGLVPRQDFNRGKQKLGPISKQGDRYLRRILIVGAISVLRRARENLGSFPGSRNSWRGDLSRSWRWRSPTRWRAWRGRCWPRWHLSGA